MFIVGMFSTSSAVRTGGNPSGFISSFVRPSEPRWVSRDASVYKHATPNGVRKIVEIQP